MDTAATVDYIVSQKTCAMKPKAIFKLAIRLLGLYFLYNGLCAIGGLIPIVLSGSIFGALVNVFMCAWQFVVAWWLIGGAPLLIQHAYSSSDEDED